MSNSSRIEAATRQHIGATLTSEQITELVKLADPNWHGGIYPSDVAYKRTEQGLVPRGKTAYGDGVLEYLGSNSFKVLPTDQIIRRKNPAPLPVPKEAAVPVAATPTPAKAAAATGQKKKAVKKAGTSSSRMGVAPREKANLAQAARQ